jgi:hypothetical protein
VLNLSALVSKGPRHYVKSLKGVMLLGVDLRDAREEIFVRMVCDGIALGVAYVRAGFKPNPVAASELFALPRIQERANKILEARRTTGVVTLSEVTDMLQRVFAGAHSAEEYSAAHNAAFSLARLYGHVTDKATLEVIRRPSRDPDAPSEQVLSDWVASLPVVSGSSSQLFGPEPAPSEPADLASTDLPIGGPFRGAPAAPIGLGPSDQPRAIDGAVEGSVPELTAVNSGPEGSRPQLDLFNDSNGLAGATRGMETGNGAPTRPVTGTPAACARTTPLVKRPAKTKQVPVKKRVKKRKLAKPSAKVSQPPKPLKPRIPSARVLFG